MKLALTIAAAALSAATLSACGGTNQPVADPTTSSLSPSVHTTRSTPPPARSSAPQTSLSASEAVTSTVDPCQVVTRTEASALAHASFGPGKEEGTKIRHECVYGAQTPNVLTVFVVQAASPSAAQAGWDTLLSEAQQFAGQAAGKVRLTPDSTIGDKAEWVELNLSQIGIDARGLAFLKGPTGVYMIDLVRGGTAAGQQALAAEAQTAMSRLP